MRTKFLFAILSLTLLAGCGQAPLAPVAGLSAGTVAEAEAAGSLSTKVKARFRAFYNKLDKNKDKNWTSADFDMPEDRFLNCFRSIDTDNDKDVSFEEYWPKERHDDMIEDIQARSTVFAMQTGGKTSYDEAFDLLDVYLKPYLAADERNRETEDAFKTADANKDKTLNKAELAFAIGIMEAKAFEHYIEKQINRSKGQPDKPKKK
jgi:hypothetical protein